MSISKIIACLYFFSNNIIENLAMSHKEVYSKDKSQSNVKEDQNKQGDTCKFNPEFVASLAKIKSYQEEIKNKMLHKLATTSDQPSLSHSKDGVSSKKNTENKLQNQHYLWNEQSNKQVCSFREQNGKFVPQAFSTSRSIDKQKLLMGQPKTRKVQIVPVKESLNYYQSTNRMLSPPQMIKIQSEPQKLKKSSLHQSSQNLFNYKDEVKLLKRSKFIEPEVEMSSLKNLKQLKETVSTTASNKTVRQLRIQDFILVKDLGKGKFGNVKMAMHKKTGMLFSIKVINKAMVRQDKLMDQLIKETKIQTLLSHSHIVKLYSVFADHENVYLLMELCCEGNLYEHMQKKGRISEEQTKEFMKETCEAVSELHSHKIIHRDIKPQNIVMCFGMVKICDFGWSTSIQGTMRETFCGSPLYISPQLLKGQLYDEKVDLWALGILGFQLLTGTIPFEIVTEKDLIKIVNSKIIYPSWMSPTVISFLQELLNKDPNHRAGINEILQHPFIR